MPKDDPENTGLRSVLIGVMLASVGFGAFMVLQLLGDETEQSDPTARGFDGALLDDAGVRVRGDGESIILEGGIDPEQGGNFLYSTAEVESAMNKTGLTTAQQTALKAQLSGIGSGTYWADWMIYSAGESLRLVYPDPTQPSHVSSGEIDGVISNLA